MISQPYSEALKDLLSQHGRQVVNDAKRVENYLLDCFPDSTSRARIRALHAAVRDGIASAISSNQFVRIDASSTTQLESRLINEAGLSADLANFAVKTWAQALGKEMSSPTAPGMATNTPTATGSTSGTDTPETRVSVEKKKSAGVPVLISWLITLAVLAIAAVILLRLYPGLLQTNRPTQVSRASTSDTSPNRTGNPLVAPEISRISAFDTHKSIKRKSGEVFTYHASNMHDNSWDTAWCAQYDPNREAWIEVFLRGTGDVARISMTPGFAKPSPEVKDLFKRNHRMKDVDIVFPEGRIIKHRFDDEPTMQTIRISPPERCSSFRLIVKSIYLSLDDPDLAVVELRVE